jgi:ubiquinone/menaquinone biosynthesis C-methylase UbiE
MTAALTIALTAVVYAVTFPLAWMVLARLVARSASRKAMWRSPAFWAEFLLYRLIIFAPYGVLLGLGHWLPAYVPKLVWGWVVLTLALSAVRFTGTDRVVGCLWWLYGFCYDGLRGFYPYRRLIELTTERVGASGTMQVLDLGCGTGNVLEALARSQPNLTLVGVDGSSSMLRKARKKLRRQLAAGNLTLVQADVPAWLRRQAPASFDRIVMVNLLYALPDRPEVWRECLRLLKPRGIIVATTSDRPGSRSIVAEHLQHDRWWKLLSPRLICIGIIDYFINEFARVDIFQFPSEDRLLEEVRVAGGSPGRVTRCYGDVNILFTVGPVS